LLAARLYRSLIRGARTRVNLAVAQQPYRS
jgi:hypothetical protein